MSKSLWISGIALLLMSATAVRADDARDGPKLEGPVQIQFEAITTDAPDQQGPVKLHVQTIEGPGGVIRVEAVAEGEKGEKPRRVELLKSRLGQIKLGDYWLGVRCAPVPAVLRAQLDLPEDQGLVVESVVPDSPAAKAEIKQYDVLMKAGDTPLREGQDLVDAVQKAKDQGLSIELVRRGKAKSVTVTPAKTPKEGLLKGLLETPGAEALDTYKRLLKTLEEGPADEATRRALKYLQRMQPGEALEGPMRFKFFGPGAILPPGTWPRKPLPGNMSISITREGDKPAKIVVQQDGKKWEVTDEELDKLPKDVRPHVERMLGRVVGGPAEQIRRFDFVPDWKVPERLEERLEKRLDEMNRRIEQLRKSIDELREKRPRLKKSPDTDPESV